MAYSFEDYLKSKGREDGQGDERNSKSYMSFEEYLEKRNQTPEQIPASAPVVGLEQKQDTFAQYMRRRREKSLFGPTDRTNTDNSTQKRESAYDETSIRADTQAYKNPKTLSAMAANGDEKAAELMRRRYQSLEKEYGNADSGRTQRESREKRMRELDAQLDVVQQNIQNVSRTVTGPLPDTEEGRKTANQLRAWNMQRDRLLAEKQALSQQEDVKTGVYAAQEKADSAMKSYKKAAMEYQSSKTTVQNIANGLVEMYKGSSRYDALAEAKKQDEDEAEKNGTTPTYDRLFALLEQEGMTPEYIDRISGQWASMPYSQALSEAQEREKALSAQEKTLRTSAQRESDAWEYEVAKAYADKDFAALSKPSEGAMPDGELGEAYNVLMQSKDSILQQGADFYDTEVEIGGKTLTWQELTEMSDEEKKLFFYYCNTGNKDMAALWLSSNADALKYRRGETIADLSDYPVLREITALGSSAVRGAELVGYGIGSVFADIDAPDVTSDEYALASLSQRNKGTVAGFMVGAAQNIGNMAPSLAGYAINPAVGLSATFLNARGNAYVEAKRQGYTHGQAWVYSTLVGASEAGLEKVLGGLGGIAKGVAPEWFSSILPKTKSVVGKLIKDFTVNAASEIVEENLQNYLDPAFAMIAGMTDEYDKPGSEEFWETTIVTAITTLFFSAAQAPAKVRQEKINRTAGRWADAAIRLGEDNPAYNEGVKLRELLDGGENVSPEQMIGIFERVGKENATKIAQEADVDKIVEKAKAQLKDVKAGWFTWDTAIGDAESVTEAWEQSLMEAYESEDAQEVLKTAASAVKLAESAQINLDNAYKLTRISLDEYDAASKEVQYVKDTASEVIENYRNGVWTTITPMEQQTQEEAAKDQKTQFEQAYIDAGAPEDVAKTAGEVLDGIVSGEITSQNITNRQIMELMADKGYGREAIAQTLGVEVTREATASKQRSAVKAAIAQYEASAAQRKNTAAGAMRQENITPEGVAINETEGKQSVRGDEGRQGVVDPGEQAGIVGESGSQRASDIEGTANITEAERKSLRKRKLNRQVERFDEVTAYKNASEVFGSEKYEGDIAEIPEEYYTEGMREAADKLAKDGVRVRYFKGTLMSETHDGRMRRTPGLFRAGTNEVWASVSSARFTPEQLAMHEYYHALVNMGKANVEQTVQEIKEKFSPEEFDRLVEQYLKDYRGAYEGDKTEDIYEELLADAYAGMNRFAQEKSAVQYQDVVSDQIQHGTNENERATRDTRGAPESKFSFAGERSKTADIRYSFDDEDYMLAVEAGDMDAAQEMVDEAAQKTGYTVKAYHGTNANFNVFRSEKGRYFFSKSEDYAEAMMEERSGQRIVKAYLKMENPYREKLAEGEFSDPSFEKPILDYAEQNGYDSAIIEVDTDNELVADTFYVVFSPEQIKSADPVTYDDNGKIIPISERFNAEKTDIRYSFEDDVEALDEEYRQVMDSEPVPHRTAGDLKREIRDTIARGSRQEQAPEPTATVTRTVPAGEFYPEGTTVTHTYGRGKPFYSKTTNLSPKEALSYLQAATGMKWRIEPMRKGLWKAVMTTEKLDTVYAPAGYNKAVKEAREADKNAQAPTVKEFAEQKLAEGWRDPNAPTAATVHTEGIKKSDFTASKALNKIGVKIDGSVTDYSITQNMRSAEEARRRITREINKAEKYWDATKAEKQVAVDIANGDLSYFDIPDSCRFNVVSELAALRMDERMAGNNLVQQRRYAIRDSLLEKAMDMFPTAEEIEKNPSLFHPLALRRMNFRTAQRNMLSIFGDELGAELYEYYFAPVTRNEASRQRWMNKQFDKVRKFEGSDGKTKKLTRAESAYVHELLDLEGYVQKVNDSAKKDDIIEAAQELGDPKNAEENTILDMAVKYDLDKEQTSWMVKYAQWIAMQEGYSSKVDVERCKAAAAVYRQLFDDYFEAINDFLVAHGAIPINKIEGYTPHMTTNDKVNLLSNALETLGFNANATRLPAEIAGRTEEFRPNKRWTPFFEHRTGDRTDYDIVKGFESYVTYISDVLFHMDDIQKIRSAEEYLRQGVSGTFETSIQEAIDMSRSGNTEDRIDYLKKLGRIRDAEYGDFSKREINEAFDTLIKEMIGERKENTRYSDMVTWLQNYANVLAGKQYGGDRGEEHEGGRGALTLGNKINALFARANVAGNLSSALNQMAQLPTLLSERRTTSVVHAIGEFTTGKLREFAMESDFLTSKKGVSYITRSVGEMTLEGLFKPTEFMDSMLSTLVVRSAYLDAVKDGMSHEAAMRYADNYGQKIMADRSRGAKPLTFYNKGLIKQALRMFQIEALNSWEHIFLDLPRDFRQIARDKGKASAARAVALVIVKYLIAAFVLNRWTEEEYGGTPAPFDLFGMTANFIASGSGLTTNEWIKRTINKVTAVDIFEESNYEEFDKFDWGAAVEDTTYNLSNEIPFASNVVGLFGVGDRTIPTVLPGIIKAGKGIYDAANENGVFSDDTLLALVDLLKSAVPGGRQISKTIGGIRAAIEGGKMNGTGENERLQYVTDDSVLGIIQQVLFGVNATEESKAHYASGENGLTVRQTQMWKEITEQGGDGTELFELIQGYRRIGNDDSLTSAERREQQRNVIAGSSFTDEQKAYIYSVLFGEKDGTTQDEPFGELMDAGMSWDAITEMFNEYKRIYNDDSIGASEQTTEFQYWIDKQNYTKKQREIINDSFRYGQYSSVDPNESNYSKLVAQGVSPEDAKRIVENTTASDGEGVKQQDKVDAILKQNMSDDKTYAALGAVLNGNAYDDLTEARAAGISCRVFMEFREKAGDMKADKDPNDPEKTIAGSKKEKVVELIDSLQLTTEQKDVLYLMYYEESGLYDTPWH